MKHQMKLYEKPFENIKSGRCKIELRLFDEKRRKVNLGDTITFSRLPELDEKVSVEVIGLLRYKTFHDLVEDFPISDFGYPEDYDKRTFVEECYDPYTPQEEKRLGVLGIRIKLI